MVRKTNYDYDDRTPGLGRPVQVKLVPRSPNRSDDEDFQIGDEVEIHGLQGASCACLPSYLD